MPEKASTRLDLAALIAPDRTALLTVEVQEGVVGTRSAIPTLAAAAAPALARIGALAAAARAARVPVLHCTAEMRADRLGSSHNARLFALARRGRPDPAAAAIHPAVGLAPGDLVLGRLHGVSPMTGTSLDPILRNLGVTTLVATGVSVNVALLGLAFEAVNRGYQVVLPRDATAGIDDAYVDAVYANTLSLLATVTIAEAVIDAWAAAARLRS